MSEEVTTFRLYLMRLLYLMNFALLGLDVWPTILSQGGTFDPVKGVAFSFWGALALVSALGIRYPLAMLPVLLLQFVYKLIWILAVALPQWPELQSTELANVMLFGIVVDAFVIPWPSVVASYVLKPGDRWRWRSAGQPGEST